MSSHICFYLLVVLRTKFINNVIKMDFSFFTIAHSPIVAFIYYHERVIVYSFHLSIQASTNEVHDQNVW